MKIVLTQLEEKKHSELIVVAQIIATPPERKHIIKIATPKLEIKHSELIAIALPVEALCQQSSRVTPNPQLRARKRVCNSRVLMTPKMVGTIPLIKNTTPW